MNDFNMRHAFLIMAHNNVEQLNVLLETLDSDLNDIYLHIDVKSDITKEDIYPLNRSKLFFFKEISVFWADFSQVRCELFLLKKAIQGKYHYYHLISGADMPLKTPGEIADYFENDNKIYLHFTTQDTIEIVRDYFRYYHFFQKQLYIVNRGNFFSWYKVLNKLSIFVQKLIGIDRCRDGVVVKRGANWFSIPFDAARYVLEKEKWIIDRFDKTRSSDEFFMQTVFYNSDFRDRLFRFKEDDSYESCLRYIDWKRGNPYTFREDDYEDLISSDYLFARKFDWQTDKNIILKIYNYLKMTKGQDTNA